MYPPEYKYTKDHEWISVSGSTGRVGITDYAQKQLGDVVFVELPEVGVTFKKGDVFGSVESVKAVSELYCPASGEVTEVNTSLADHPEAVNQDAHRAWMIGLKLTNPEEVDSLIDSTQYSELVK